ncbi:TRAFAC clade GTPase domain-containing protein [Bradyrhizobium sp. 25ACV]
MMWRRNVVIVGGVDAGKTNYLLRFWLAMRDRKHRALVPDGLPIDAEYLNLGVAEQLKGQFAGHTQRGTRTICEIPVKIGDRPAALVVPDGPGEDWQRLYVERRWPADWERLVGEDSSFLILVRVHSDEIRSPLDWIQVQNLFGANANLEGHVAGHLPDGPPTQVILVEWIQMIIALCKQRSGPTVRPRIGVLITAWDLLSQDEQTEGPNGYLKSQYRLLSDYLRSNEDRAEFATFGVSLFGGDLKMQP